MPTFDEELNLFKAGYRAVGGIDEAGRGPLAGPVVAACVVSFPGMKREDEALTRIDDSKKLSEKKREELFDVIYKSFAAVGVGWCDHSTIDRINILEAAFLAMKKAIGAARIKPEFILLDGKFSLPNISLPQKAVIGGDGLILSIAAASIVAKVVRDRMMRGWNDYYPLYGFNRHKGYGTKLHLERLRAFGPCPIHRKSFAPVKDLATRNL
jgi:ribonuclease HII